MQQPILLSRQVLEPQGRARASAETVSPRYKGIALSNTTLGVLTATINSSILLIALLGPAVLGHLPASNAAYLTGHSFFPELISGPFSDGLTVAFGFAIAACLIAAVASGLRGGRYVAPVR